MENWREFVWQLFFGLLVIFFGGWILGSILNFVALASPHMVSIMFCPAGSTATYGSTINQPSQDGTISCQDKGGASVPALSDADSIVLQRKYFYRPSNIIVIFLVAGWFICRFIWRRKKNEADL